ncbi:MAG: TolC family protein [Bacteroidaceae bacterium]|nr:TolC family protein [Bacteroidaceae bacterium]
MFNRYVVCLAGLLPWGTGTSWAAVPDTLRVTLSEVVCMAQERSSDAMAARHTLEAAEWSYRYYRADRLPSVTLTSSPNLNRQLNSITQPDGTNLFRQQNQLSTNLTLNISQNIAKTGGNLFVRSSLQRQDEFENHWHAYSNTPVLVGYSQSLFGYNGLKWERRTEPLRYQRAQKAYRETMELIASRASSYFFSLAGAQTELDIARQNQAVADTLQRYARGRYNIGTITENEMLQLEVSKLSEETGRLNAEMDVEDAMQALRSYLGIQQDVVLQVVPDTLIPHVQVTLDEALALAMQHSPDPDGFQLNRLESESNLAYAKANRGLKADFYVQFGLSQTGPSLSESYRHPLNQEYASVGLSLPLLDWGRGKGRVRVAQSQLELTETQTEQGMQDFRQNVTKMVRQFNLQAYRVEVAYRTRAVALRRYEVARWLYIQERSTLLELNSSITEKDAAQRNFIAAVRTFWSLYYGLRSMCGNEVFSRTT